MSVSDSSESEDDEMLLVYSAGSNQTFVVEKLQPYTLYRVRLKTCIPSNSSESNDCVVAEQSAKAKTLPTSPQDISPPELTSISPYEIEITWSPPSKPNGILTQYQVCLIINRVPTLAYLIRVFVIKYWLR